jgi:hypothetical protein
MNSGSVILTHCPSNDALHAQNDLIVVSRSDQSLAYKISARILWNGL